MAQVARADLTGLHVLVLTEDGRSYLSLERQLTELGATAVSRARVPDEALQVLRSAKIDVLVTDLYLPFIRYLRTGGRSPNPALPIVASSDCQYIRMIRAARDAGIDAYVGREATAAQLGRHVREAVRRERSFITGRGYTGPDRRHHVSIDYGGGERRGMAGSRVRLSKLDRPFQGARVA